MASTTALILLVTCSYLPVLTAAAPDYQLQGERYGSYFYPRVQEQEDRGYYPRVHEQEDTGYYPRVHEQEDRGYYPWVHEEEDTGDYPWVHEEEDIGFPDIQSEEVVEAPDDYHGQRIDTPTDDPSTDTSEDLAENQLALPIDLRKIDVTVNRTHVCISYGAIFIKFCFEKSQASKLICGHRLGKILTLGCRIRDEEKYLGLCYKKCSILTNNRYPLRTATNTCAKNGCSPGEEKDAGLCYPKCKAHYKGVGPVCWGYCSHFCGSKFTNLGLYCYRWWPPAACKKPSYGRGVGKLPHAPWTKGLGCNGFGINGDGKCAKIDILKYVKVPYIDCP